MLPILQVIIWRESVYLVPFKSIKVDDVLLFKKYLHLRQYNKIRVYNSDMKILGSIKVHKLKTTQHVIKNGN